MGEDKGIMLRALPGSGEVGLSGRPSLADAHSSHVIGIFTNHRSKSLVVNLSTQITRLAWGEVKIT